MIKQHTLLPYASELIGADARLRTQLSQETLRAIVDLLPDIWLGDEAQFASAAEHRDAYVEYLSSRLAASETFVKEAINARTALL